MLNFPPQSKKDTVINVAKLSCLQDKYLTPKAIYEAAVTNNIEDYYYYYY